MWKLHVVCLLIVSGLGLSSCAVWESTVGQGRQQETVRAMFHACSRAEECLLQCKGGRNSACIRLAHMFSFGSNGAPLDLDKAEKLWVAACGAGESSGCTALADLSLLHERYHLSFLYASKSCVAGDPEGCSSAGLLAFLDRGPRRDVERARVLWEYACARGDARGCGYLGLLLLHGAEGVLPEPTRARVLFEVTCEDSSRIGCAPLGLVHELGLGGARDLRPALGAYLRGCDGGSPSACVLAGRLIEENSDEPEHRRRASSLYEQGCEARPVELCWVEVDSLAAWSRHYSDAQLSRRMCGGVTAGALACFNAGLAHQSGSAGLVDVERAQSFFDRACSLGLGRACRTAERFVVH